MSDSRTQLLQRLLTQAYPGGYLANLLTGMVPPAQAGTVPSIDVGGPRYNPAIAPGLPGSEFTPAGPVTQSGVAGPAAGTGLVPPPAPQTQWGGMLAQGAPLGGPGFVQPAPVGPETWGPSSPMAQFTPAAHQASLYRGLHGVAGAQLTADQLNAMSLAAAQAGRTTLNPQLAALYGRGTIPGFNVTNALQAPPATASRGAWQPNNVNFLAGQPAYNSSLGPIW